MAKVYYFRNVSKGSPIHDEHMYGTHGKDPMTCKACVKVMVAVVSSAVDENRCYVGIAFRNPLDQINRKIGRAIAIGRAYKNVELDHSVDKNEVKAIIDAICSQQNVEGVGATWMNFALTNGLVKENKNA